MVLALDASAQIATGDPAAGRQFAQANCAAFHAVDGGAGGKKAAGSFSDIALLPSTTSISLHAFLLTPHPSMPNYRLTPADVDDVVAFILSLRTH